MKNLIKVSAMVICIFMVWLPKKCFAVGLGIYVPAIGSGSSTVKWSQGGESANFHPDVSNFGYGLVFDTRVANPGIFNYRLSLGYENANFTEAGQTYEYDFSRFSMDHTFGFAFLQTDNVRLWLGPQLLLVYMTYNEKYSDGDVEVNLYGIGIAPVLGANFNLGSVISLSPELGYRFSILRGESERRWDTSIDPFKIDWNVNINEYFLRLNLILRINDI
jgi:hypothetical protein